MQIATVGVNLAQNVLQIVEADSQLQNMRPKTAGLHRVFSMDRQYPTMLSSDGGLW